MTYLYRYNPISDDFDIVQDTGLLVFKGAVNTTADLPLTGNAEGDCYIVKADDKIYTWNKSVPAGILSDWVNVGAVSSLDWSIIVNKPISTVADIDSAATLKHQQNTDEYLTTQISAVTRYVDGNRTDSYTENGSITKPYKTIQGAINAITDASTTKKYVVLIAQGEYSENIVLKNEVSLKALSTGWKTKITATSGNTVTGTGVFVDLSNLEINNTGSGDCAVLTSCPNLSFINCGIYNTVGTGRGIIVSGSLVKFVDGNIQTKGDAVSISGGTQFQAVTSAIMSINENAFVSVASAPVLLNVYFTSGVGKKDLDADITSVVMWGQALGTPSKMTYTNRNPLLADILSNGVLQVKGGKFSNNEGAWIGWNRDGLTGHTDFVNHKGLGTGGFNFENTGDGVNFSRIFTINADGTVEVPKDIKVTGQLIPTTGILKVAGDLEVTGETKSPGGIYFDKKSIATISPTPKWLRFADTIYMSGTGHTAGLFEIIATLGGAQGHILIDIESPLTGTVSLNLLGSSQYGQLVIEKIRVLKKTNSDLQYIEMYVVTDSKIEVRQHTGIGWALVDMIDGSIPTGYTSHEITVTNAFAVNEDTKTFSITRAGDIGIGIVSPVEKLDVVGNIKVSGNLTDGTNSVNISGLSSHIGATNNPHNVTKAQVGLGNVPNLDTTNAVNNEHSQIWKTPPGVNTESVEWSPTVNQTWDITSILTAQGVPSNASVIFLAWGASALSDVCAFEFLDASNVSLGSIGLFADFPDNAYGFNGITMGSMIPIPGGTKKIKYSSIGLHVHNITNKARFVSVCGWQV